MGILADGLVHIRDGADHFVFGGVLVPLDHRAFDGRGMAAGRECLLLLGDLFRGVQTDLRKQFMRHGELRIECDGLTQAGDG